MQADFKLIYQSSGTLPLRMLNILCLTFFVGGLMMALLMLRAPQAMLTSNATRLGWVLGIAAFAVACPVGAWLYGRRLATQILLSKDGTVLRVYESNLLGSTHRDIPVQDAEIKKVELGDAEGEESVGPSRFEVKVRGQRGFTVAFNRGAKAASGPLLETLERR